MQRDEGLKEIEEAKWEFDSYGCLNIKVHDEKGRVVHAHLRLRPEYCDRGHIQLLIDGIEELDEADSFPRYFFSSAEAQNHTKYFLKWRLWKHRTFQHQL